jgi:hypothetical protein
MPFVRKKTLVLRNYDGLLTKPQKPKHKRHPLAPETPGRFLICGATGSGKTNVVLNLIYDLLPWTSLYVYAKDLAEPKYEELRLACEAAQAKEQFHASFECDPEDIVSPDDLDPNEQNLIIFDDFCLDRTALPAIAELFIRSRKKNATVIFITQSYYDTPKIIRLQCTCFILFAPNDEREMSEMHKNHNCGMTRIEFVKMFHEATAEPYSFLCIDKQSNNPIRKKFDYIFKQNT